ncbi:uncharacterized protein DS421_1g05620 [Arachis hypogaea]|nr:uncharacterized protein DS421_1g05620 [Arachis hypogaea]
MIKYVVDLHGQVEVYIPLLRRMDLILQLKNHEFVSEHFCRWWTFMSSASCPSPLGDGPASSRKNLLLNLCSNKFCLLPKTMNPLLNTMIRANKLMMLVVIIFIFILK